MVTTPGSHDIRYADALFRAGDFSGAEQAYGQVLDRHPADFHAALRFGHLALLANRLPQAEQRLARAAELDPDAPEPKRLLAEVFRRSGRYDRAAPLVRAAGCPAAAEQLESFAGTSPYETEGPTGPAVIPFTVADPLPVIEVRANGSGPVSFFIDTGAAQVILDTDFAAEVGAEVFGSQDGTFAGGQRAAV